MMVVLVWMRMRQSSTMPPLVVVCPVVSQAMMVMMMGAGAVPAWAVRMMRAVHLRVRVVMLAAMWWAGVWVVVWEGVRAGELVCVM